VPRRRITISLPFVFLTLIYVLLASAAVRVGWRLGSALTN
jgi:hypothetical protein